MTGVIAAGATAVWGVVGFAAGEKPEGVAGWTDGIEALARAAFTCGPAIPSAVKPCAC